MLLFAFVAALALATGLQSAAMPQATVPEPSFHDLDDIVITARKGRPAPTLDAVGYFRRYCYEPNRLTGRSSPPSSDPDWTPLDHHVRAQFGVADPDVPAFGLTDADDGRTLLLKIERLPKAGGLVESRCTMVIIGGADHRRLPGALSALFRGSGTQRHVGAADGSPRLDGWEQRLWSAMPARRSKSWREVNSRGQAAARGTWVVVTDLRFYDDHDYVMGDLKTRTGAGKPLSLVTLGYTTRLAGKESGR